MRYALVLLLLVNNAIIHAQDEITGLRFFTTKDGLSNNTIYTINQDYRGFVWIGTKEGLSRFDGLQFQKYFADKNGAGSLSSNSIFDILEYVPGKLLIATSNGLSVLNTITGNFENDRIKFSAIHSGSGTIINSLFKDKESRIWVNHSGELDILDTALNYKMRFTDIPWAKKLKGIVARFSQWQQDSKGNIWLPGEMLQIIDFASKQVWNNQNNPNDFVFLKAHSIRSFLLDEKDNILWYAPWGMGLTKYDFSTKKTSRQFFHLQNSSEKRSVNKIVKTKNGDLLCATGAGLFAVNMTDLKYHTINTAKSFALFETKPKGYFWQGTDDGMFQLSDSSFTTELVLNKKEPATSYCNYIFKTRSGLLYAVYSDKSLIEVGPDRHGFKKYIIPGEGTPVHECEDDIGNIWLATSSGARLFNPSTKSFSFPSYLPMELRKEFISAIFSDEENNIWLTTTNPFYIYKINPKQKKAEKITNAIADNFGQAFNRKEIWRITEDGAKRIWFISIVGGGILCFNKTDGNWQIFPGKQSKTSLLLNRGFTSVHSANNHLWVTDFYGNGLFGYDFLNDSLNIFTRNNGLLSDYILNVCSGDSGELWLTTENGITQFSTKNFDTKRITFSNLKLPSFKDIEAVYDKEAHVIVYALSNRIVFVDEKIFQANSLPPHPMITSIAINNLKDTIDPAAAVSFTHDQNNISINFTAIEFNDPDNLHFSYKLEGLDKDWQSADLIRIAQYANLAPGNYSFKLRTKYENGIWSTPFEGLKFTIKPPFWETWWFRLSALAIMTLTIFFILWNRIRHIRKEAGLKHKIAETEMMALRAQMNPHFIFNCITAIDNLIQSDEKEKATAYLAKFARLIRNVLESSKNELMPFHKDYQALNLFLQLEQFRCNNKFQFELIADNDLMNGDYKVPPLLIQPFLENAIHHGLMNKESKDKKLSVNAVLKDEGIKYTITDNGVGRKRALEIKNSNKPGHVSYGIQISGERIQLFNKNSIDKDLVITDLYEHSMPTGTKVEVKININNHHNVKSNINR